MTLIAMIYVDCQFDWIENLTICESDLWCAYKDAS